MKKQILIFLVTFIFSFCCLAKPWMDPRLRKPSEKQLSQIPVILLFKDRASFQRFHQEVRKFSPGAYDELSFIQGAYLEVNWDQLGDLSNREDIRSIVFNRKIHLSVEKPKSTTKLNSPLTYGLQKIGLNTLWNWDPSLNGNGIRVGILDTGIDADHPEFKGKILRFKNFSPASFEGPADGFGHGTHVAGTIVGGELSGTSIGVAPSAKLIVGRIFDSEGNSDLHSILRAMQWMMDPDENPKTQDFPHVVNNSWSDDEPYGDREPDQEPLCVAVTSWKEAGLFPVFAAGNKGPKEGSIGIPAACPDAFSIAATNSDDRSPHFSASGPAKWKSVTLEKPDISAPGVDVYSSVPRNDYEKMTGTSMATPHASGAIALLAQKFRCSNIHEIQRLLKMGAKDLGPSGFDRSFGWGRINIYESAKKAAVSQQEACQLKSR